VTNVIFSEKRDAYPVCIMQSESQNIRRLIPNIDLERCNACGNCVALCPTQAVEIVDDKAVIMRPEACTYCDVCETFCPEGAIGRPFTIEFAPDQHAGSAQ
jgi:MinD superfamily P-loop ATPase